MPEPFPSVGEEAEIDVAAQNDPRLPVGHQRLHLIEPRLELGDLGDRIFLPFVVGVVGQHQIGRIVRRAASGAVAGAATARRTSARARRAAVLSSGAAFARPTISKSTPATKGAIRRDRGIIENP